MFKLKDMLVLAICAISVVGIAGGLLGEVVLYSTAVCLLIFVGMLLAHFKQLHRKSVVVTLSLVFAALIALFIAAAWSHDSSGPLRQALGFPIGTAFFVWAIWPLGLIPCILHVLTFDRSLLPKDEADRIISEFGAKRRDS